MTKTAQAVRVAVLRQAALQARLAPSVHNTQPWTFVLRADALEIRADVSRQLTILDPRGRQLTVSCGCALFNARVSIAAGGYEPLVERYPDPIQPSLLARVTLGDAWQGESIAPLDDAIPLRRTNRRAYVDEAVPADVVRTIVTAAEREGAQLVPVSTPEHRTVVAELTELAERIEQADPRYLAELRAWTTDDPRRGDGVQASTMPYAGVGADRTDCVPIRGFDTLGIGWLPSSSNSNTNQCLVMVCAPDDPLGWLRAGEALEHAWLELTRRGYFASPLTQLVEVQVSHDVLQSRLSLPAAPQLLLRIGRAPHVAHSPRRRVTDVIADLSAAGA